MINESLNSTNLFYDMASYSEIMSDFETMSSDSLKVAESVASSWYSFSKFMPWFLASQASSVSTNELRYSLIKIAYEELGEGNRDLIHADAFVQAVESIGVNPILDLELLSLNWLKSKMKKNDQYILGLSLGLEIIANENISKLIELLSYKPSLKDELIRTYFFSTHIINEDSHIEENLGNYKRFCLSDEKKEAFLEGYLIGLEFWKMFWKEAIGE